MNKQLIKNIINLSNIHAVPSREESVANYIKKQFEKNKLYEIERDNLGNISIFRKANHKDYKKLPTVMIMAHMDEVGFLVSKIEENGFIRFEEDGDWWNHVILGQRFIITTQEGKQIIGVAGATPPHFILDDKMRNTVLPLNKMFLDIGVYSKKEVEALGIKPGCMITPDSKTILGANKDFLIGKAFDNRAAIAVAIEVLSKLEDIKLDCNLRFIGSVQEEPGSPGLRGANTSTYKWTSDVAFNIDITVPSDTPGSEPRAPQLGNGVCLSLFDKAHIANKKLLDLVENTAIKNKIKYTLDGLIVPIGSTDAGPIHMTKDGIYTLTLSIPTRYVHSHNSVLNINDCQATTNLLYNVIKDFSKETFNKIKFK